MFRYIVNHGEGLMTVDFSDDLSLTEKLVQHKISTVELIEQKLSSDSESEYEGIELRVQDQKVSRTMEEGASSNGRRRLLQLEQSTVAVAAKRKGQPAATWVTMVIEATIRWMRLEAAGRDEVAIGDDDTVVVEGMGWSD
ncbi:hypothetical protein B296_00048383 [Ensete ventricosum]|uniref:Uncharacterized protein n=1 Tax=Ensete ventricosum TaxID=4639 RepID=A0A426X2M8_ENSVE|nr:hypothetical protein B296_00048383 [Ensete ventricosum]